ncbi:MAG TPA: glutathione synthase [Gammaproteobacteria bacterium]|nr:glutathione synthase [Gammaproteobacteria bacterium]
MSAPRLGVVMDPIERIKPRKDTTFALLLEAQRRGWAVFYMELGDLYLRDGVARARLRTLAVRDVDVQWWSFGGETDAALHEVLDVVLMRKDPPVDAEYLYATHILDRAEVAGVHVFNRPQALRDANEKLYTAWFADCCPPTLVTSDHARLRAFLAEQGQIVLKPLDGMGGRSIFVVARGDPNTTVILDTLTARGTRKIMAQRYLPEIAAGDKRILLVDGEPVPYALARIPAPGETRGNLAAGGRGEGVALGTRDRWICTRVGPTLRERGLVFAGLDVIGDYLTEINVTSPTCVRELDALYGLNIAGLVLDAIERRLAA